MLPRKDFILNPIERSGVSGIFLKKPVPGIFKISLAFKRRHVFM